MSVRNSLGRSFALAAVALAMTAGASGAQQLPPAQQIVDKYVQAIGGRTAITRFQQRKTVAEINMPANGMTMTMEMYQAAPNRMFTKMEMAGMGTFTSGYDGTVAWSNNPMQGPRVLEGAELNETLRQADFAALLDPSKSYTAMQTVGEKTVAGRPCWNVKMTHASGVDVHSCFDKENGLLVHSAVKQVSAMGEINVEAIVSDYKDFDGIKMATKTVATMMGQEMSTTIKSVSHAPIDASVFAVPAEIRALRTQD
jgi:hypothetical protein